MSEIQEVDVFIDKTGKVSFEIRGVKGKQCLDLTKDIEILLGGKIVSREFTPEYDEQQQNLDNNTISQKS